MKPSTVLRSFLLGSSILVTATSAHAATNVIVNGDFETGTLAGWTLAGSATTVSSTSVLSGTQSAVQVPGAGQLNQVFTPFTAGPVTTSFIFSATDPGAVGTRSMNVAWRDGTGNQINLRLSDFDNNGVGDIEVFDTAIWQTVLPNAVVFDATPSTPSTTLTLTINSFGLGANYDLTVGAFSAPGLNIFQNGVLSDYEELSFVSSGLTAGSSFKFDNVSVVPEPSVALLGGLGLLGMLRRRR